MTRVRASVTIRSIMSSSAGLLNIMGGETEVVALGAVEARAGQGHELADSTGQARQIPAAADIGEQADAGLGHGERRVLGRDAEVARQRNADAAAHRDPVHDRDRRLGISEEQVVEAVFGEEEALGVGRVLVAAAREHDDVAAGAEAAALGMVDDHRLDAGSCTI